MSEQITTPVGRLVGGHPMTRNAVTDKAGQPVKQADGITPATEMYVGIAIPKTAGVDWKQEPWGQQIVTAAVIGWKGGETNAPGFAWKVIDGDSTIPNKKGKIPNQKEGYPGHWVLNCSSRLVCKAFHVGKYDPTEQIQDANAVKPGDYCRLFIEAKANFPAESPGVYLNPTMFELSRAGELIVLDSGPSASEAFGGAPATTSPAAAPPVQPAPDFLNPATAAPPVVIMYTHPNGQQFTREALVASGWQDAQIDALPHT